MNGCGFFAWNLSTIQKTHTPVQLADLLRQAKVRWVSWKVSDGETRFNQIGGNDKALIDYMVALEAVGIKSGGWSYCYPERPGAQAGVMAERVAKFSQHVAFDHLMIDIEPEWKKQNLGPAIDSLLYMDINKNFPVGFCSYRYPSLHAPLNFTRFLKHETIKFNAPQVYWIDRHDPRAQLERSYSEYSKLTDKPFVPMGAAFGVGSWAPTSADLQEFVSHCISRKWYTYGWWSLDWVLKHNRMDWLEAIAGVEITPPVEPLAPMPAHVTVQVQGANIRSAPAGPDLGGLDKGARIAVVGEDGDWWKVSAYVSKKVAK